MNRHIFGNKIVIGLMPLNIGYGMFETETCGFDVFGESDEMDENNSILYHIGGTITADDDFTEIHSSLSGSYRMLSDGTSYSFEGKVSIDGVEYPLRGTRTWAGSCDGYIDVFINPYLLK